MIKLRDILKRRDKEFPSFTVVEGLKEYKDQGDVYIHFGKVRRLKLNPMVYEEQGSPVGIYFYVIKEYWKSIEGGQIDYAQDRPYAFVLKPKNKRGLVSDTATYSNKKLVADTKKLEKKYGKRLLKIYLDKKSSLQTIEDLFENYRYYYGEESFKCSRKPIAELFRITSGIARDLYRPSGTKHLFGWNEVLNSLGYNGFVDKSGLGCIHKFEMHQGYFINENVYDTIKTFKIVPGEYINVKNLEQLEPYLASGKLDLNDILNQMAFFGEENYVRVDTRMYGETRISFMINKKVFKNNRNNKVDYFLNKFWHLSSNEMVRVIDDFNVGNEFWKKVIPRECNWLFKKRENFSKEEFVEKCFEDFFGDEKYRKKYFKQVKKVIEEIP